MDWVPLVWAVCIFVWQVQYLWAVIELPNFSQAWTLIDFLLLLSLSLLLFIAAALVLPDSELPAGESLADVFRRDGRWALLALSAWACTAIVTNLVLFEASLVSFQVVMLLLLALLPAAFLAIPSRRVREVVTGGNLVLTLWAAWELSPKAY